MTFTCTCTSDVTCTGHGTGIGIGTCSGTGTCIGTSVGAQGMDYHITADGLVRF